MTAKRVPMPTFILWMKFQIVPEKTSFSFSWIFALLIKSGDFYLFMYVELRRIVLYTYRNIQTTFHNFQLQKCVQVREPSKTSVNQRAYKLFALSLECRRCFTYNISCSEYSTTHSQTRAVYNRNYSSSLFWNWTKYTGKL